MRTAFITALLVSAPAFAQHADHGHHHAAPAASAPAAALADGEVRKVDREQGKLTLRHGPIPGLDMPPMTMVFRVADPAMLEGLKEGDKVRFAAERVDGALTVVRLERTPYAGLQGREIKALSAEQVDDLRAGRGMGASLPAELNGVPGPMHVLQMKERLELTAGQQQALERVVAEMKRSAQDLGTQVIAAESALDRAFASGSADEAGVAAQSAQIAALNGRLRAVHLVAHLQTKRLLSERQVAAYNHARGYGH